MSTDRFNDVAYNPSLCEQNKTHWWWIKVICGVFLILGVVVRFTTSMSVVDWRFPVTIAQCITVLGGLCYVWHYFLFKRALEDLPANSLVTSGGLFDLIRHPMYFSDALYYPGLALLWLSLPSIAIVIVAWVALIMQAKTEDAQMASQFGVSHANWRANTKLIVPYIY